MTTYMYDITLNDSERISLEAAIDHYVAHCEQKIAGGAGAPYWADRGNLLGVRKKLAADGRLTSTIQWSPPPSE